MGNNLYTAYSEQEEVYDVANQLLPPFKQKSELLSPGQDTVNTGDSTNFSSSNNFTEHKEQPFVNS